MRNDLLYLNKTFKEKDRERNSFPISVYQSKPVELEHLKNLLKSLESTEKYWSKVDLLGEQCLVSAYSKGIVAKTHRIAELFKFKKTKINDLIVGARFGEIGENHFHIFTYCISKTQLSYAIKKLEYLITEFENYFSNNITKEGLQVFKDNKNTLEKNDYFTQNQFVALISEMSYIDRFDTYFCEETISENAIVTLFDTNKDVLSLLRKIDINITNERINLNNVLLLPDEFIKLKDTAPYLISMAVSDFSLADLPDTKEKIEIEKLTIGEPTNEPIIGVIDTLFNKDVYFNKWVDYVEVIDAKKLKASPEDYAHGTAISSLIVDLPQINPQLDDGCGRFRVRHFGVALKKGGMTTFTLMKKIETIISTNPDIHVWNLSLGSTRPINKNFISPEASILDELQVKYPDIIFVIAGTNTEAGKSSGLIGAPADSINSLVVNSVRLQDLKPASYSRSGPALSFFIKPDVSYYGGDYDQPLNVCYPYKIVETWGTSLAAPLIARKMAYMIDVLKIPRACAKALIIDSAIGWKREFNLEDSNLIGRGIVPIDINDVIKSNSEEIRFYIEGQSNNYKTYEYDLPVPLNKDNKFPYVARAVLCYFPHCSRNQGVDYTDTELNIKFGRTRLNVKNPIEPINKDYQDKLGFFTKESEAREQFRKWDNVKILTDSDIDRKQAKKNFGRDNWGLEVSYFKRYVENGGIKQPQQLKWGLVVTLKAIDGQNRIEEFIQSCVINEWRVYRISVDNMVKIYTQSQVEVNFEDDN